jgi:hypothetical protein
MEKISIVHCNSECQKTFPDGTVEGTKPTWRVFELSNDDNISWDTIERLAKLFNFTEEEAEDYFTTFSKEIKKKPSPKRKKNDLEKSNVSKGEY